MFERYYIKPSTIDRIRSNWLAPQIERYVEWMDAQGYAGRNVFHRVPILCQFADFARELGAADPAAASLHIDAFATHWLAEHGAGCKTDEARHQVLNDAGSPVRQMLQLALDGEVKPKRPTKPFPFQEEAPGFLRYLREERGLRDTSVYHYQHYLNRFSAYLKRVGVVSLGHLSPALLAAFVVDSVPGMARTSRRNLCGALRVFLRYGYRERVVSENLTSAVEMPQSYRLADVPRSITWDEVRRMLAAVDRRSGCGRRDYAILLLLVTYGLRAHEVVKLTLEDIDWERERFQVSERKAGHWSVYPLAGVVAEALIDYLKNGRPPTTDRHLFFRTIAPRLPISSAAVSSIAHRYLVKAGIHVHRPGAHTLRHTCVQRLIDAEFPLKTIGDYVGHRSPDSTKIYTKVSIAALREVAMGDGELL